MHLALDLSKRSTGWAGFKEGWPSPRFGHWALGSEFTSTGQTFQKLHRSLNDLWQIEPFETVAYEEPLLLGPAGQQTTRETQLLLIGLMAHVESFCAAKRIRRCNFVHMATWRRHFIGGTKRGTQRADLKRMTMDRCKALGWNVTRDDEADACGVLSYQLHNLGIATPWNTSGGRK